MITIYEHPASAYAQKVKIALTEKKIEFRAIVPRGLGSGIIGTPDFLEANPRHEVPLLVDGNHRIFDSTIILEYIEENWPQIPLLPDQPARRARLRMIEDVMDTQYEALNWLILEVKVFERAKGTLAEHLLKRAAEQIGNLQAWLEQQLGTQPWFNGPDFGWGDLSVVPHVNMSSENGVPARNGKLRQWLDRANQRPSVRDCANAARAAITGAPDLKRLVSAGMFRRQYRDHRLESLIRSGGWSIVREALDGGTIRFSNEQF